MLMNKCMSRGYRVPSHKREDSARVGKAQSQPGNTCEAPPSEPPARGPNDEFRENRGGAVTVGWGGMWRLRGEPETPAFR